MRQLQLSQSEEESDIFFSDESTEQRGAWNTAEGFELCSGASSNLVSSTQPEEQTDCCVQTEDDEMIATLNITIEDMRNYHSLVHIPMDDNRDFEE